jgi:hypothetical protein
VPSKWLSSDEIEDVNHICLGATYYLHLYHINTASCLHLVPSGHRYDSG